MSSATDPTIWQAVGPFAAALMICLGWIAYLRREVTEARKVADRRADETLALAERALPVLIESSSAVRESTDLLRRQGEALAAVEVLIRDADRRERRERQ